MFAEMIVMNIAKRPRVGEFRAASTFFVECDKVIDHRKIRRLAKAVARSRPKKCFFFGKYEKQWHVETDLALFDETGVCDNEAFPTTSLFCDSDAFAEKIASARENDGVVYVLFDDEKKLPPQIGAHSDKTEERKNFLKGKRATT